MHTDRRRAESFGGAAERYDRARPSYPAALLDEVLGGPAANLDVLDVGCGTGIASRLMAARGARVLGVEADGRMAEAARARGTAVEVGRFETWDPAGRLFDRVTAAQAWHWVDPVAGAAKAASVLRPGGRLCAFWNAGHPDPVVSAALVEVYHRLAPGADTYSVLLGHHRKDGRRQGEADRGMAACPDLTEPEIHRFPWRRMYTRDEWLDQLPTHSDHAALPPERMARLLDEVGAVIDRFGGHFEMGYSTLLVSAYRVI